MKILNVDDLIEAAQDAKLPFVEDHITALEEAAATLADALCNHFGGVGNNGASWQGKAFAGLCVGFYGTAKGKRCPQVIADGDPDGDWHMQGAN